MNSNGGVSQLARVSMVPMINLLTGQAGHYAFDPLFGFNDPNSSSVYSFRVEELICGRVPTVRRIIVTYRDLGIVSAIFSLSGTNDDGQIVSAATMKSQAAAMTIVTLGNKNATNKLLTKLIAIQLTAQNPQLTITRLAGAGPLSISKVVMCGNIEGDQEL